MGQWEQSSAYRSIIPGFWVTKSSAGLFKRKILDQVACIATVFQEQMAKIQYYVRTQMLLPQIQGETFKVRIPEKRSY